MIKIVEERLLFTTIKIESMKKLFTLLFILSLTTSIGFSQTAPDFSFTDINGETHTLSETLAEGKVVLLDFFFVDCGPCNTWGPEIDAIAADFEGTTLEVWAISDRDANDYIANSIFNPTHENHFVGGSAGGGSDVVNLFASSFNFTGFPTYSVICSDGSITWDLWPLSAGATQIRDELTEDCGVMDATPVKVTDIESLQSSRVYPNPATDLTTLEFNLNAGTDLKIEVINTLGQVVETIAQQNYQAGIHTVEVNVAKWSAGLYLLRMQSDQGVQTIEFVVE